MGNFDDEHSTPSAKKLEEHSSVFLLSHANSPNLNSDEVTAL